MSDPQDKPETAPELTPEAKAVLARARKSFMVSMALLVLGLIAIGGALVYRASQSDGKGGDYVIAALKIPAGGKLPAITYMSNNASVEQTMKVAFSSGQATFAKSPQIVFVLLPSGGTAWRSQKRKGCDSKKH